jgi:hypothetical protein
MEGRRDACRFRCKTQGKKIGLDASTQKARILIQMLDKCVGIQMDQSGLL